MKSKRKSEAEKALDLKIKELRRLEHLTIDVQRVVSALKKCNGDIGKAENILEDKWGAEKAKNLVERYRHFMSGDSNHPDSQRHLSTFLRGLDEFRNQIKKGDK